MEILQKLSGTSGDPDATDDPQERESRIRGVVTLGDSLAGHRQVMNYKARIMANARGDLYGEDPALPRSYNRVRSLQALGYLDEDGEFDADSSWDPSETAERGYVKRSNAEIAAEHAARKAEILDAADSPTGWSDDSPYAGDPHDVPAD
jgi:hypothetical protein